METLSASESLDRLMVGVPSLFSIIFLLASIGFWLYGGYFSGLVVNLLCIHTLPVLDLLFWVHCLQLVEVARSWCAVLVLKWVAAEVKVPKCCCLEQEVE